MKHPFIVAALVLLCWPAIAWVIVKVRFSSLPEGQARADLMQKWGGD